MPQEQQSLTEDEFLALFDEPEEPEELTEQEFVKQAGLGEGPGAWNSFKSGALEGLASAADVGKLGLAMLDPGGTFVDSPKSSIAEGLRKKSQEVAPQSQRGKGGLFTEDVPRLLGQIGPGVVASAVNPAAGLAVMASPPAMDAYTEIKAKTGDPHKALAGMFLTGASSVVLERLGVGGQVNKIFKILGKADAEVAAIGMLKGIATSAAKGAAGEYGEELGEQVLHDQILEKLSGKDVKNLERLLELAKKPELAIVGGLFGTVRGIVEHAASQKPSDAAQDAPEAKAPTEAPKPKTAQAAVQGVSEQATKTVADIGSKEKDLPITPLADRDVIGDVVDASEIGNLFPKMSAIDIEMENELELFYKSKGAERQKHIERVKELKAKKAAEEGAKPKTVADVTAKPPSGVDKETPTRAAKAAVTTEKADRVVTPEEGSTKPSEAEAPGPTYFRGSTPGDTRRVKTGDDSWDSYLFVTDTEAGARLYGKEVERVTFKSGAKILREGTREFAGVAGRWRKGESLLEFSSRAAAAAKAAGYDAVHFKRQTDIGTAILNEDAVVRGGDAKTPTGIKNEETAKRREAMGLDPVKKPKARKDKDLLEQAKAKMKAEPEAANELMSELEKKPRALNDDEDFLLSLESRRLVDEQAKADERYIKDPTPHNKKLADAAQEAYDRASGIYDAVGTEGARGFRARQVLIEEDYSLAAMKRKVAKEQPGAPLTPKQESQIRDLHKEIAAKTKELDEYKTASEAREAKLRLDLAIQGLAKKAKGTKGSRKVKRDAAIAKAKAEQEAAFADLIRQSQKAASTFNPDTFVATVRLATASLKIGALKFEAWAEQVVARVGEHIRPYLKDAWEKARKDQRSARAQGLSKDLPLKDQGREIEQIAKTMVEDGVTDPKQLVKSVHEVLSEHQPDITTAQVEDAISGHGSFKRLTRAEAVAARKQAREELKAFNKTDAGKLEISKKRRKTYLENRIKQLDAQIKAGDFSKKARKPLPTDEGITRLMAELETTKARFELERARVRQANQSFGSKAARVLLEPSRLMRDIWTSFDMSAVLRQGLIPTLRSPIKSIGYIAKATPTLFSKKRAEFLWAKMQRSEMYDLAVASKLPLVRPGDSLTPDFEGTSSYLGKYIPGIAGSGRAFHTYLNLHKMNMFSSMVKSKVSGNTHADYKHIADLVGVATGVGKVTGQKVASAIQAAAEVLWSPKLYLARIQMLTLHPLWGNRGAGVSKGTRVLIAGELLRAIAGYVAFQTAVYMALSRLADDKEHEPEIERDPTSSDFGKVKIGRTRVDTGGGFLQFIVLASRIATRSTKSGGKSRPLTGDEARWSDIGDVAGRFFRSKLSPGLGTAYSIYKGKDMIGEKVTWETVLEDSYKPLGIQDYQEAARDLGIPQQVVTTLLNVFGAGSMTYKKK